MIFFTLYKTEAKWIGRQPKNHLSTEGTFKALCGRNDVQNMGGAYKYISGNWYIENAVTNEYDIKLPPSDIDITICKKCLNKAIKIKN